jgi:hypothetical protein
MGCCGLLDEVDLIEDEHGKTGNIWRLLDLAGLLALAHATMQARTRNT